MTANPRNVFRAVVALSLALSVAGALAALFPGPMSQDWETILLWHGQGGITDRLDERLPESVAGRVTLVALSLGVLGYVAAVVVGLFFFKRFARFGFVCVCALHLAVVPFDGIVVMTPLEAALLELALLLDGVIVAMSYLPPIAYEFDAQRSANLATQAAT